MAGAHCAPTSFITPLANPTPLQRRPLKIVCSVSTPSASKPSKRKNYLRPKLLKTLKKPFTHPLLPDLTPIKTAISVDSTHEQSPQCPSHQLFCPNVAGVEQKEFEHDEFRLSETCSSSGVNSAGVGISSETSIFKAVMYLVGLFVFQTIVSVWVLSSADSDEKNGSQGMNLDSELLIDEQDKPKMEFSWNGLANSFPQKLGIQKDEIVKVDESELEKKIAEIRTMARDAREKEGVKLMKNDLDNTDDDDTVANSGIKKEVDNRLVVLTKRLKKNYQKPVSFAGLSSKDVNDKDDFNAKMANAALMYEKKHKFRRFSADPSDKPKGFQGSENDSVTKLKSKLIERMDEMLKVEMPIDDLNGNVCIPSEVYQVNESPVEETKSLPNSSKNLVKEKGTNNHGKGFGGRRSQPLAGNNQLKSNVLSRESHLKRKQKPAKKADMKYMETNPWWSSLKYALVIMMRSSHDGEGPEGLYTLNGSSDESYTVALEDCVDATNLCYILESFFADIEEEFSVDILPLSIKELELQVESSNSMMNVLFVKKGKIKLYAGQPLEEVERALRSMI